MGKLLFYDTETTGVPEYGTPSDDPIQPHLVQIAAALVDEDTRKIEQSINLTVRPNGYEIPQATIDIHGVTNEYASEHGVTEEVVLMLFMDIWGGKTVIAHNESFDARIIRIGLKRYAKDMENILDAWKNRGRECTKKISHKHAKAPLSQKQIARGIKNGYKAPTLTEAFEALTDKKMVNSHTAMGDVLASIEVYFAVKDLEKGE